MIREKTVWADRGLEHVSPEWRGFIRWVMPLVYGINFISYGTLGVINGGSRIMVQALTPAGSVGLSILIALASAVSFYGIAFCKHQIERISAIVLIFGVVIYLGLLAASLGGEQPPVGAFASTAVFSVVIAFRVLFVSREIGGDKRRSRA